MKGDETLVLSDAARSCLLEKQDYRIRDAHQLSHARYYVEVDNPQGQRITMAYIVASTLEDGPAYVPSTIGAEKGQYKTSVSGDVYLWAMALCGVEWLNQHPSGEAPDHQYWLDQVDAPHAMIASAVLVNKAIATLQTQIATSG